MKNVNMLNSQIKNIFIESWDIYKRNISSITQMMFIFLGILVFGIYVLSQLFSFNEIDQALQLNNSANYSMIFFIAFYLFITGLHLGATKIALLLNNNKNINTKMLFSSFHFLIIYFLGQILISLPLITLELLLNTNLFILRIIISLLAAFYPFIIIDQKIKNPILGLRKSFIMSIQNLNLVIPIYFILLIANIFLGGLTLFLGLIVSLPFSLLCYTKLYILLLKKTKFIK